VLESFLEIREYRVFPDISIHVSVFWTLGGGLGL